MKLFVYDPERDTKQAWENAQRRRKNSGKKSALTLTEDVDMPDDLNDGQFPIKFPLELICEFEDGTRFRIGIAQGRGSREMLEIRNEGRNMLSGIAVLPCCGNVVHLIGAD